MNAALERSDKTPTMGIVDTQHEIIGMFIKMIHMRAVEARDKETEIEAPKAEIARLKCILMENGSEYS